MANIHDGHQNNARLGSTNIRVERKESFGVRRTVVTPRRAQAPPASLSARRFTPATENRSREGQVETPLRHRGRGMQPNEAMQQPPQFHGPAPGYPGFGMGGFMPRFPSGFVSPPHGMMPQHMMYPHGGYQPGYDGYGNPLPFYPPAVPGHNFQMAPGHVGHAGPVFGHHGPFGGPFAPPHVPAGDMYRSLSSAPAAADPDEDEGADNAEA
jgi:hypothetical protein